MSEYKTTIGLEVHAELKTATKMFCNSKNDQEETQPNVNICPVCVGHPGTLPVINEEAVRHMLRIGKAVGGELADFTEFDRKNYFYPDIPKGYQISQYKFPLVSGGMLAGVELTRIHLEEDTARSLHEKGDYSLVDFNRAGLPLMELVTEPVVGSAEEAGRFARELQLLLRYLDVSDANMEKGQMRVEANVSVSKTDTYGTKVEVKNLNSFRSVERAIEHETKRQIDVLESGGKVDQETRGWNDDKQETFSQRKKEEAQDYRYFPDPDIPKLKLSDRPDLLDIDLPELPWERRERYGGEYGIKGEDVEMYVYDPRMGAFFEVVAQTLSEPEKVKLASNYITSDIAGLAKEHGMENVFKTIQPEGFAKLIELASDGQISSRGAKDALRLYFETGDDPLEIVEKHGLLQKSDEGELLSVVTSIIGENPKVVDEYKAGKVSSLQYLVGQGMKATKGSANPQVLKKLFEDHLK